MKLTPPAKKWKTSCVGGSLFLPLDFTRSSHYGKGRAAGSRALSADSANSVGFADFLRKNAETGENPRKLTKSKRPRIDFKAGEKRPEG